MPKRIVTAKDKVRWLNQEIEILEERINGAKTDLAGCLKPTMLDPGSAKILVDQWEALVRQRTLRIAVRNALNDYAEVE